MIPMIMNREVFYVASVLIAFVLGALFAAIRLRRR